MDTDKRMMAGGSLTFVLIRLYVLVSVATVVLSVDAGACVRISGRRG